MQRLEVKGVAIDDTYAEAFGMRATAIIITGPNRKWARQAAVSMTGFATSVIGCGCEAAIDFEMPPSATPDGRPGCRVMIFAVSTDELQKQLLTRVGQCVLTSPAAPVSRASTGRFSSSSVRRCAISATGGKCRRSWEAGTSGVSR